MTYLRVPDVPFTDASVWTPELGYFAFQAPVFDDETGLLGHRERLRDDELSNATGAIKSRVLTIEDGLRPVRPASGRLVTVRTGRVLTADGLLVTVPQTVLQVADNATSFIYTTATGVVEAALIAPVVCEMIATVTTVNGEITSLVDSRAADIRLVLPQVSAIKVFGGTNTTDIVATQGQVFAEGIIYCRNFTVPAGITVTVDRYLKVICSGTFLVEGTIDVLPGLSPGAPTTGAIRANDTNLIASITAPGLGANGGSYPWAAGSQGTGGATGQAVARTNNLTRMMIGGGGDSGGTIIVEAVTVTIAGNGTINANGGHGIRGAAGANTAPGTQNTSDWCQIGGGGGGSGGLVYLSAYRAITVAATATVSVRGGDGGTGFVNTSDGTGVSMGGRPGGGGYMIMMAPLVNVSGANLVRTGGNFGTPAGQSATLLPGNVVRYTIANAAIGGAMGSGGGGGFGGIGGRATRTQDATFFYDTQIAAGDGQLVIRNFVPVGG